MCTLTYIPIDQHSFIWTQNRDESPSRNALKLIKQQKEGLLYPQDFLSGGSWIAASRNKRVVSLLNGAFFKHPYHPSRHKSRGLVLLDAILADNIPAFLANYSLEGVEPFTIIIREEGAMWELRWDKTQKYFYPINPNYPYIWSSSSLYDTKTKVLRQSWFKDFLDLNPYPSPTQVQQFHLQGGINDPNVDLKMHRPYVQTISMTTIIGRDKLIEMQYNDMVHNRQQTAEFVNP